MISANCWQIQASAPPPRFPSTNRQVWRAAEIGKVGKTKEFTLTKRECLKHQGSRRKTRGAKRKGLNKASRSDDSEKQGVLLDQSFGAWLRGVGKRHASACRGGACERERGGLQQCRPRPSPPKAPRLPYVLGARCRPRTRNVILCFVRSLCIVSQS